MENSPPSSTALETELDFTKPQQRLIKSRFFRWAQVSYDLKEWKLISKLIEDKTGIKIPYESLRQNFRPVNKGAGKPPRNFDKPERYQALYRFLIDQRFIHPNELAIKDEKLNPVYGLYSFLNKDTDQLDFSTFESLAGRYEGSRENEEYTENITLNIDYLQSDKPVTITMDNTLISSQDNSEDIVQFTGFAVSDNNGWYLFLLTDTYTKSPVCYLLIQTAPSITAKLTVQGIALFEYEGAFSGELNATEIQIGPEQTNRTYHLTKDFSKSFITLTRISSRDNAILET